MTRGDYLLVANEANTLIFQVIPRESLQSYYYRNKQTTPHSRIYLTACFISRIRESDWSLLLVKENVSS